LGEIVRVLKAVSTTRIRRDIGLAHFSWQRNYFERVIRSDQELDDTRAYIQGNPLCWHLDEENPNR
jgi:putative transposase